VQELHTHSLWELHFNLLFGMGQLSAFGNKATEFLLCQNAVRTKPPRAVRVTHTNKKVFNTCRTLRYKPEGRGFGTDEVTF
jgi:hypothetical protein